MFSDFRPHTPGPEDLKFGNSEPTVQHSACPLEKKYCLMSCPGTSYEDKPTRHLTVRKLYTLSCALMHGLTHLSPDLLTNTQTADHTLSTTDQPWPSDIISSIPQFSGFRTYLFSNHCPGVMVCRNQNSSLPMARNLVVGMLSNVQCRRNQHSP